MKCIKNFLIQLVISLLKPKTNPLSKEKRILIVTTTALGDTLWATPSITSLRNSFPEAHICVLTSKIGKEVLQTNPYINKIFQLPKKTFSLFSLWKDLYQEQFDTILVFHTSQRLTLPLCSLLGASLIVGTKGKQKDFDHILTHPIDPIYEHEISRRLKMVELIGGKISEETLLFVPEKTQQIQLKQNTIILHPGSKDPFRRWPVSHFAETGRELIKLGMNILITGSKDEEFLIQSLQKQIPSSEILFTGNSLNDFALAILESKMIITNDTGPLHLACALNHPVIGIFGASDPILFGVYKAPNGFDLKKPMTCYPCLKRNCKKAFCLLQITPKMVILAVQERLERSLDNQK